MNRRAFIMRLKPKALAEYQRRHASIWPDLVAEVQRSGIASITTFVRGDEVIVVSEVSDESAWDRLWNSDVHRRWAQLMEPLLQSGDHGAVDASELSELFHIATRAAPSETSAHASERLPDDTLAVAAAVGVPDMVRAADHVDGVAPVVPGAHAKAPCAPGGKPKHKMAARGTKKHAAEKHAPGKHAGETRSPRSNEVKRKTPRKTTSRIAKSTKQKAATKKSAKQKPAGRKAAGKSAKKRTPSKKTRRKKATGKKTGTTTRAKRKTKRASKKRR